MSAIVSETPATLHRMDVFVKVNSQDAFQIVHVQYDSAGRMISRSTAHADFEFEYDSTGNMARIANIDSGQSAQTVQDHFGRTLYRTSVDGSI